MIRIRGLDHVGRVGDLAIRRLVKRRLVNICDGDQYDPDIHGEFLVVERGDTLSSLESQSGCPVASNPFNESRFPDPEFDPVCECLEEHKHCFEVVFLFSDDGAGVSFFIPKSPEIDADVTAFCAAFAVPAKRSR